MDGNIWKKCLLHNCINPSRNAVKHFGLSNRTPTKVTPANVGFRFLLILDSCDGYLGIDGFSRLFCMYRWGLHFTNCIMHFRKYLLSCALRCAYSCRLTYDFKHSLPYCIWAAQVLFIMKHSLSLMNHADNIVIGVQCSVNGNVLLNHSKEMIFVNQLGNVIYHYYLLSILRKDFDLSKNA